MVYLGGMHSSRKTMVFTESMRRTQGLLSRAVLITLSRKRPRMLLKHNYLSVLLKNGCLLGIPSFFKFVNPCFVVCAVSHRYVSVPPLASIRA